MEGGPWDRDLRAHRSHGAGRLKGAVVRRKGALYAESRPRLFQTKPAASE